MAGVCFRQHWILIEKKGKPSTEQTAYQPNSPFPQNRRHIPCRIPNNTKDTLRKESVRRRSILLKPQKVSAKPKKKRQRPCSRGADLEAVTTTGERWEPIPNNYKIIDDDAMNRQKVATAKEQKKNSTMSVGLLAPSGIGWS